MFVVVGCSGGAKADVVAAAASRESIQLFMLLFVFAVLPIVALCRVFEFCERMRRFCEQTHHRGTRTTSNIVDR